MTGALVHHPDARLDLVLERVVDVPAEFLWRGWTVPEQLKKWFTPVPWKTLDCESICGPAVSSARWCADRKARRSRTSAVITPKPGGNGTLYTALVLHGDEESRQAHEKMGFDQGWGKALDQLLVLA